MDFFKDNKYTYKVLILDVNVFGENIEDKDKYILSGYTPESMNIEGLLVDLGQEGWRLVSTFVLKEQQYMKGDKSYINVEVIKGVFEKVVR